MFGLLREGVYMGSDNVEETKHGADRGGVRGGALPNQETLANPLNAVARATFHDCPDTFNNGGAAVRSAVASKTLQRGGSGDVWCLMTQCQRGNGEKYYLSTFSLAPRIPHQASPYSIFSRRVHTRTCHFELFGGMIFVPGRARKYLPVL